MAVTQGSISDAAYVARMEQCDNKLWLFSENLPTSNHRSMNLVKLNLI